MGNMLSFQAPNFAATCSMYEDSTIQKAHSRKDDELAYQNFITKLSVLYIFRLRIKY